MTDPRIEAAAWMMGSVSDLAPGGDWERLTHYQKTHFRRLAKAVLEAADAAARVRVVPFPIPDDRMETAKNTLLCWKGGAISDEDCVGMIVCGAAAPPEGNAA